MRVAYDAVAAIVAAENDPAALIDTLERLTPTMQDDSVYWHTVLVAWVKNGRTEYQDRYRVLMQSKRRNRIRAMKRGSLRVWRALPDPLIAHRLVNPGEDVDRALSWTLDYRALDRIYGNMREVVTRAFPKSTVPFYTDRRGEAEVVVLDASLGTSLPPGSPTNARLDRIATSRSPSPVKR